MNPVFDKVYAPPRFSVVLPSQETLDFMTKYLISNNVYYKAGGTGAYKEGNPTAGYYENNVAKMAYKRIFIKHKKETK